MRKEAGRTPRRLFPRKDLIGKADDTNSSSSDVIDDPAETGSPRTKRADRRPLQSTSINLQPWPVLDPFEEPSKKAESFVIQPFRPDDADSCVRPSPKKASPRKPSGALRFVTPPASPSKPRLRSPTKSTAARIPASPHRPSLDAFWSQDVINEWNDAYSPRKSPSKTPRARRVLGSDSDDDDAYLSPSERRQRSQTKTPKTPKKDKAELERRQQFNARKEDMAAAFLKELDDTVTGGKLAALSESTGGVRIVWSKKLNSTAGRANWKRETVRHRPSPTANHSDPPPPPTIRHHAFVELAAKVIDSDDRLLNVLAHEFCHLANFMVSGVTDQPHGRSFQRWAGKVTAAFPHKGIEVTTKHSYAIAYKYAWECGGCGGLVQRHSRSLDPARHACGRCGGALVQVRPAPRSPVKKEMEGSDGARGRSRYQAFVKRWYAEVKKENDGWSMGQIMAELARRYRLEKKAEEKKGKDEEGVDRSDKGLVRSKRKSVMGNAVEEVEEVVVLETDEVGQVEEISEEDDDSLGLDLKSLSLAGTKS